MGGVWRGAAAGLVLAALGLGALSLAGGQPAGNRPPEAPEVVAPSGLAGGALPDVASGAAAMPPAEVARGAASDDGAPRPTERPLTLPDLPAALLPGEAAEPAVLDTAPAARPEAAAPAPALALPDPERALGIPGSEPPVRPARVGGLSSAPREDSAHIDTASAFPPEAEVEEMVASPEPQESRPGSAPVVPEGEVPVRPGIQIAPPSGSAPEADLAMTTRRPDPVGAAGSPSPPEATLIVADRAPPPAPRAEAAPAFAGQTGPRLHAQQGDAGPGAGLAESAPPPLAVVQAGEGLAGSRVDAEGPALTPPAERAGPQERTINVRDPGRLTLARPDNALGPPEPTAEATPARQPDQAMRPPAARPPVRALGASAALADLQGNDAPAEGLPFEDTRATGVVEPSVGPPPAAEVVALPPAAPVAPSGPAGPGRIVLQGGDLPLGVSGAVRVNRPVASAPPSGTAATGPTDPSPAAADSRPGANAAEAPDDEMAPIPEDAPALLRFAAPFDLPGDGRAPLAVVLLDDGSLDGAAAFVAALPMPVTVALDPTLPDATDRMATYRTQGIEVLALMALPTGALPVDAAVSIEAILSILPEALGVLDLGEGGLEAGSATAGPALARLAEEGLGAVLLDVGLGATERGAEEAGVPVATVLRDLDGAGQDAATIRRFLDDAARRAAQEDGAVVLARVRPESLAALTDWAKGRRAREVAPSPVSALLRDEAAP